MRSAFLCFQYYLRFRQLWLYLTKLKSTKFLISPVILTAQRRRTRFCLSTTLNVINIFKDKRRLLSCLFKLSCFVWTQRTKHETSLKRKIWIKLVNGRSSLTEVLRNLAKKVFFNYVRNCRELKNTETFHFHEKLKFSVGF